jgi:hypothetical protein
MIEQLSQLPGDHLVFVRYDQGPQTIVEWVYNGAELDGQRVILARDLGDEKNVELRRAFSSRRAWRVTVSGLQYQLRELP